MTSEPTGGGVRPDAPAGAPEEPRRRRPLPVLHPLLFAAFPILSLFSSNVSEATWSDVRAPLALSVAAAAVLLVLGRLALRSWRRAGLVVSAFMVLFLTYGYAYDAVDRWHVGGLDLGSDRFLAPAWALVGIGILAAAWRTRRPLVNTTKVLNYAAAGLVATSLFSIVSYGGGSGGPAAGGGGAGATTSTRAASAEGKRDVYYIILDRYPGRETLKREFGIDNGNFYRQLSELGFYVAHESYGPYPRTVLSLDASLHMEYLDDLLTKKWGARTDNWHPSMALLQDYPVARFLKKQGYTYVHLGNWWTGTKTSRIADVVYTYDPLSEFSRTLVDTTALGVLSRQLGVATDKLDRRHVDWGRTRFMFRKIADTRHRREPTFTFAHFTLPHDPYIFDRDGSFQTQAEERRKGSTRAFVDQLEYANRETIKLLRSLLSVPEAERPIVVLQSDEGPHPHLYSHKQLEQNPYGKSSDAELKTKLQILNAYYLPGIEDPPLYQWISPVNTFRMIFDLYFETRLGFLPDESYVFTDWKHIYDFVNVTDRLRPRHGGRDRPPS